MGTVLIGIGPVFLVLFIGLVVYTNRRRIRWRAGSQPMPPPQAGSIEWPGPTTGGMDYGPQSPFNSPQPQPPAQPSPLLWFKMVAPSRRAKILFGVAAFLFVAGLLVVIITANLVNSRPIPLSLSMIAAALVGLGGLIVGCLALAAVRRQRRGWRPEGWPPG